MPTSSQPVESIEAAFATDEEIQISIDEEGRFASENFSVAEIRAYLGQIQDFPFSAWTDYLALIESGEWTLVSQNDEYIIVREPYGYGDILDVVDYRDETYVDECGLEYNHESYARDIIWRVFYRVARRKCGNIWDESSPIILEIPDDTRAQRELMEHHLLWLMNECGLSGDAALDYLMVGWRGVSQSSWARRAGKDESIVSENVRKARSEMIR